MKTYVAPSMTASEFDNHDIVSCVPCLIRVFGGGREYYGLRVKKCVRNRGFSRIDL